MPHKSLLSYHLLSYQLLLAFKACMLWFTFALSLLQATVQSLSTSSHDCAPTNSRCVQSRSWVPWVHCNLLDIMFSSSLFVSISGFPLLFLLLPRCHLPNLSLHFAFLFVRFDLFSLLSCCECRSHFTLKIYLSRIFL